MSEETNQQQTATEALCEAIRNNDVQGVEKALAAKADVNAKDAAGKTALFYSDDYFKKTNRRGFAPSNEYWEIYELLLTHDAKVNLKARKGDYSRLSKAVSCGNFAPTLKACLSACRALLERGADVNDNDGFPLRCAAYTGASEICKLLLEHGADVNAKGEEFPMGFAPLRHAAEKGHMKICSLLLEHGADVNIDDGEPLIWAVHNNHKEICKLLLEHGADANAGDGKPLRSAVLNDSMKICELLLEHGADVKMQDHIQGTSPLHQAAEFGNTKICELLLEHGVDVNVKNENGRTPLYLAEAGNNTKICKLLKAHGAE